MSLWLVTPQGQETELSCVLDHGHPSHHVGAEGPAAPIYGWHTHGWLNGIERAEGDDAA